MIEHLQKLGFNYSQSKVVSILLDGQWHTRRELERGSDLCQPVVSLTLKSICDYIEVGRIETVTKGASMKPVRIKSIDEFFRGAHAKIYYPYVDASNAIKELRDLTGHPPHDNGS